MSDVLDYDDQEYVGPIVEPVFTAASGGGLGRLQKAAVRQAAHDAISEADLAKIGADVVADWERDKTSNKDWREKAEAALDAAAQEAVEPKNYPFKGAANVRYPLLTTAMMAFSSRAVPAIIKGDEAIRVKTFGKARQSEKQKRADRVSEYLNYKLFYGVDGWEQDTDAMLVRLPAIGQHYRKVWWDPIKEQCCIESVSALRLTLPADTPSLRASPRITHDYDRYPYQLQQLMASGHFRTVDITPDGDDDQAARVILEQHRYMDLDDDGLDEPYIVTVDFASSEVLRIDEAWEDDGIVKDETGAVVKIDRWMPFVDYGFIPDPKGRAYSIGFGHLLTPIMDVINTNINLMIDAGHAQVAGGGFFGSEMRLQGAGQNGVARFQPGEYKNLPVTGDDIRKGIYERTFPAPSPVLFELLGLLMEAAKDIASINDAITGDSARSAPVGTTLALIEQGQQVFNAIYKRIYRALREEFKLFADCMAKYGDPQEYFDFCDVEPPQMDHNGGPPMAPEGAPAPMMGQPDPMAPQAPPAGLLSAAPAMPPQPLDAEALFRQDFNFKDLDIRPISDPSAVTRAQMVAKFQMAAAFLGQGIYENDKDVVRFGLQIAGIDQSEEWIPENKGPSPQEVMMQKLQMALGEAELAIKQATAAKLSADAEKAKAGVQFDGAKTQADVQLKGAQTAQIADEISGQAAMERAAAVQSDLANDEAERRAKLAQTAMTFMQPGLDAERSQSEGKK